MLALPRISSMVAALINIEIPRSGLKFLDGFKVEDNANYFPNNEGSYQNVVGEGL